jgi:hypothetical protein
MYYIRSTVATLSLEEYIPVCDISLLSTILERHSETVQNRTYVHVQFLLRMTGTMTSQNIYLFSWDILYKTNVT